MKYTCIDCNFQTKYKSDYTTHTQTENHLHEVDYNVEIIQLRKALEKSLDRLAKSEMRADQFLQMIKQRDELIEKQQKLTEESLESVKICVDDRVALRTKNRQLMKTIEDLQMEACEKLHMNKTCIHSVGDQRNKFEEEPDDYDKKGEKNITSTIIIEQSLNQKKSMGGNDDTGIAG
ncbi:MAG: hypothetical protein Hyperionvirus31_2 [Hyperionvirus sp.]|uniref:C2H2-type domain-containing protein n=1 Tax=Hyperionvirus sp. TaxID=2487770 RepID=A0A3G5ABT9_9VIRU|nr:MAG: hypothetical protein Hyperionvirus31_2 [Hyperionvirus sp.]